MSKNSSTVTKKKTTSKSPDEEVDELLKAAQDDVLLKLTINSHMAHSSSQNFTIKPDLDSRFQALKSKKSKSKLPKTLVTDAENKKNRQEIVVNEVDDIFARFSALKKSLPSYSESASSVGGVLNNQLQEHLPDNDSDEEDEVEKVIKWARDAARLDPSPPSDIEDDDNDVGASEGDTEEDSDEEVVASKTSKRR